MNRRRYAIVRPGIEQGGAVANEPFNHVSRVFSGPVLAAKIRAMLAALTAVDVASL